MLQVKIQIVEKCFDRHFLRLRKISGLSERPLEVAIKALPRSLYGIHNIIDGAVIGMGRIVGDGALNFEIVQAAVDPKHKKQGFGRIIMEHIMAYLEKEAPAGCYITLMADVPAPYENGFASARPESEGMYIIKYLSYSMTRSFVLTCFANSCELISAMISTRGFSFNKCPPSSVEIYIKDRFHQLFNFLDDLGSQVFLPDRYNNIYR